MPQVSSIVRRDTPQPTKERRKSPEARLRESPDIFSIFTLTVSFDIPSCDLPTLKGIPGENSKVPARSYGLGTGVSCAVSIHKTGDEEAKACTPGTLVALKRYSATPDDTPGGGRANRKLCQLLWQELSVFTHPYLRRHENICKLLYIGWDSNSIVPNLALELAQYGTLEDCLQHLRSYESSLRKAHLSCDIALGLAAIHACGLVHGDIKPGNIIIQSHPSRSVVAKLSDFNGVSSAESYGSNPYSFGTPEWQAPEAAIQEPTVDWQLCDVYAFCMVIATIWTKTGYIPPGGSFLDSCLQYQLDSEQRRAWVLGCKLAPDDSETSLLGLALRAVYSDPTIWLSLPRILTSGLPTEPSSRLGMAVMVNTCFSYFATQTGRDLSFAPAEATFVSSKPYDAADVFEEMLVLNSSYIRRHRSFKETMFKALLAAGISLRDSVKLPKVLEVEEDPEMTDNDLYDFLMTQNNRLKDALYEHDALYRFAGFATNISLSYLLGIGTPVREDFAISWLCLAARAGEGNAIHLFGPLEQSVGVHEHEIPRRLWCAFGTLAGYFQTANCLQDMDPVLYKVAMKMYRRHCWGERDPQINRVDPYLLDWVEQIRQAPSLVNKQVPSRQHEAHNGLKETALHLCAATGDLESAMYLAGLADADINAVNSRNETPIFCATRAGQFEIAKFLFDQGAEVDGISAEGHGIAHVLSMMDDDHGAELAPLYVSRGAALNIPGKVSKKVSRDNFIRGRRIPLFWAALQVRPLLFAALLDLHTKPEFRISRADALQLLTVLSTLHLHSMLEAALKLVHGVIAPAQESTRAPDIDSVQLLLRDFSINPAVQGHDRAFVTPAMSTALLYKAMEYRYTNVLYRRYISRNMFRGNKERTVSLLLKAGADPLASIGSPDSEKDEEIHRAPLALAVSAGDTRAFRLFMDTARERGVDLLPYLADPRRWGGYSALQWSIHGDARDIFYLLLEEYPSLADLVGVYRRRPLHSAAMKEWSGYARALLRQGASPYDRTRDRSTPLTLALTHSPNLEVADVLIQHCDDMDSILGPDKESGFTAFGKLLSALVSYRMNFGMDRLRYLVDKFGAPPFFSRVDETDHKDTTVFRTVLFQKTAPMDRAQIALETSVLEFLLTIFPDKVNFIDFFGGAALHYAAADGNYPAVEVLLRHGASATLETQPGEWVVGYTALDIAVQRQRLGPGDWILRGTRSEIDVWEANMKSTIRALVEAGGGEPGSGVPFFDSVLTMKAAGRLPMVQVSRLGERPQRSDRSGDSDWPQKLPGDGLGHTQVAPEAGGYQFSEQDMELTEIIGKSGLSVRVPQVSLNLLQTAVGAVNPAVLTSSRVEKLPLPPEGYLDTLQAELSQRRADRSSSSLSLPPGWETKVDESSGRAYYVDHNTQTISWLRPTR
ncbi:ankyrin repeats (3 copies) domain-containing protein [Purpureocillium lilacinum]|uniref:Ankyrin repeats (3 copies) domain-containing protein n=1 Tax=Purpureocillium lilacinum TaxID=33203 RepID=A0A179HBN4_PURLI|nr:ankyrin repeats (3 copies) domain-containing protein [Purpureocillium lilacinum]